MAPQLSSAAADRIIVALDGMAPARALAFAQSLPELQSLPEPQSLPGLK